MLPSPIPVYDMEVHAQLPASLHVSDGVSRWAEIQKGDGRIPAFLEGPVITSDGDLILVDVAWGRILRLDQAAEFSVIYRYDGAPNGLALRKDGSLLIADHHRGLLLLEWGREPPRLITIADSFGHERFRGLNDLTLDHSGSVLVTDQGGTGLQDPTGRVLSFSERGGWRALLVTVPSPNGIAVSDDARWIYVAVTRDNSVWRIPVDPAGGVTKVGRYIQLSGGDGPDGLAIGPNGTLLVAHLGLGVVWVFDARGLPLAALRSPVGSATSNVVVDDAKKMAYVTESETSSVLRADLVEILKGLGTNE